MKKFFLIILFNLINLNCACDLIVFSYNRPMQLLAYLESVDFYIKNLNQIKVIYRVDAEYKEAYNQVSDKFKNIDFIKQNDVNPQLDFKKNVLETMKNSNSEYLMFAVDDIIVTDFIDLSFCTNALSKYHAYGFYLRLGKNIDFGNGSQLQVTSLMDNIFIWNLHSMDGEWKYANTVDMTIYNKEEILKILEKLRFSNPNTLEYQWSLLSAKGKLGLCYEHSKIINIPVNIVQDVWKNWHLNLYSAQKLLELFNNGTRIDWKQYYKFDNKLPHVKIDLCFVN